MLQKNRWIHFIVLFVMIVSLGLTPAQSVAAQGGDGLTRETNAETGKVSFIGSQTGEPVSLMQTLGMPGSGDAPADPARALVNRYGVEFGLQNPANELMEARASLPGDGRRIVRYQQTYQGVPVFAGELIVNTNDAGDLYSISGEVAQDLALSIEPAIAMEDARNMALQAVARTHGGAAEDYVSTDPELVVFDEGLVAPSSRPAALVWKMEVTPANSAQPVKQLVMFDAQTGRTALNINQIDTAWHAGSNASTTKPTGSLAPLYAYPDPNTPIGATITTKDGHNNTIADDTTVCSNQLSTCTGGTDPDADSAHLLAGLVWGLYNAKHGRNSLDGAGMPIVSIVRYDSGLGNAFWDGSTMSYGDGYSFVYADDVIAHEMTHGVTDHESELLYFFQSGAINESFSDVWGEYFDQTNNQGTDTNEVKWLMGEDVGDLGAIRNMANPPDFGDPDSMTSPLYYKGEGDNGGVHFNSGVNNKAVYLMVDGGVFGGKTVQGIGWDKTAAIYYEVQTNLLGTGSNYSDLYYALNQACSTFAATTAHGITVGDCVNVTLALDAVKMNTPTTVKYLITAPMCPAGQVPNSTMIFEDKMEGTLSTQWSFSSNYGGTWWNKTTAIASSPSNSMYGNDFTNGLYAEAHMTTGVVIPPGAYLHFDHAYDFETTWDGGVVEYTTNGGGTWIDAGSLYSAGANYTGQFYGDGGGYLAIGRKGFTGTSYPYWWDPYNLVSTRYNLGSLAGKTVQFRFAYGTDPWSGLYNGWHIDDVQIYTCIGTPALPVLKTPANNFLVTDYTPLLDWNDTTPASQYYEVQVATDAAFTSIVEEDTAPSSQYQVLTTLDANTKYYWRVRAFNSEDSTLNWTNAFYFRTVYQSPVHSSPGNGSSPMTRRPTFTWTNPSPGVAPLNYTLQVSTSNTFNTISHTGTATGTSYTPAVDLPGGTIYWRVRANGANGPSAFSSFWSLNTPATVPPAAPTLTSPASALLLTNYQPTFAWTAPVGVSVDHYNIQFDNDSKFGSPDVTGSTPNSTPSFIPGAPLPSNVILYWRVQTVDTSNVMGAWSAARNVKMAIAPPSNLLPADGTTVTELRPLFNWDDVPGATGYVIQFSISSTFAPILHTGSPVASQYIPTVDLPKGVPVFWRVQTKGLVGPSAYAPSVATDRNVVTPSVVPLLPTLTAPAANFLTTDFSPELKWTMSATSPPFDHFLVQIDDNIAFSSPVQYTAPSSPYSPPDQTSNSKLYWRVRAVNLAGDMGNWSASRYFRTSVLPPSNLTINGGNPVNETRPFFNWDDVTAATGYVIQFSVSPTFAPLAHSGSPLTSQYTPTADLPKGVTVYWRVQAKAVNGPSAFTEGGTFVPPATIPAVPVLGAPASNFLTTDYTPTFTWTMAGAYTGFWIQIDDNLDFSSPFVDQATGSALTNFTSGALASNTKWYWRVRGMNGTVKGNWSASRYFRTALEVPIQTSPVNGSSPDSYWPTYNWTDVPGATGYNLQLSFYNTFSPLLLNTNTVTSSYDPMMGICNSTVYWRVRATGANGPSGWSSTFIWYSPSCP